MSEPCCRGCRGQPPFLLCQERGCFCHTLRNHVITSGLPFADPTARKAIRNADRRTQPKRNRTNR